MSPSDFQTWLDNQRLSEPMTASGQKMFQQLGCRSCHTSENTSRAPSLDRLFGKSVPLAGGGSVVADESYLRESILNPSSKIVQGYKPTMPTYQGQIGDEQLHEMIEYLKSLGR
jgi:cytochrome c oxidase subunit 2